jgi:hypothetical protein
MLQRRLLMTAFFFIALLGLPRDGRAGIVEVILEMSGPQFVGGGLECKFTLLGTLEECYAIVPGVSREREGAKRRVRLSLEGMGYFSTGKNSEGTDYEFGRIWMLAFDPMLEFVSRERGNVTVYHGFMGVSYNLFIGKGFDPFSNVALKLRPIGVRFKDFAVEYNIRFYSNRFTPDEFGQPALPTTNGMAEAVHSFSFLIPLGKKKVLPAAP